mgnify:FL=1
MLVEEVQQNAVSIHVVLLDILVLEVGTTIIISIVSFHQSSTQNLPSSHEAMDLVVVPLDKVLGFDTLLPLLHCLLVLILARQHSNRNANTSSVVGVDHGGVAGSGSLEDSILLRRQVHDLASPAEANDAPGLNALVLRLDLIDDLGDAADGLGWCAGGLEELAETLALLLL